MRETVCEKDKCTGCMACIDVCFKDAINIEDSLLAYNAVIDTEKCVHCGACSRACQKNNSIDFLKPIKWYQGWAIDQKVRKNGSSGGAAQAIASHFIDQGGCVCSCAFDKGLFGFKVANSREELNQFAGSKYVKSNPHGIYDAIKKELRSQRNVLFVGLPCQVAAVQNMIPLSLKENLYTIDLICHGTPSPKLLEKFLLEHGHQINSLSDIQFRNKGKFQVREGFKSITTNGVRDRYTTAFLKGLCYTENCYNCEYAKLSRVSDITLGDSWGNELHEDETKKGVSLLLCQTRKGVNLLENSNLTLFPVDLDRAVHFNHQLKHPSIKPEERENFFKKLKHGDNFDKAVFKCCPKDCFRQDIKGLLIKTKILRGGGSI